MKKVITMAFLCLLTGCASIVTGHNQSLSVNTGEIRGATCTLKNNKGIWYVNTPASVTVHRSFDNLNIACQKGYKHGNTSVKSTTKAMAFGNIVFGGAIGAGVDIASGAAYDYPGEIYVPLA
jgi:hypothetical protein